MLSTKQGQWQEGSFNNKQITHLGAFGAHEILLATLAVLYRNLYPLVPQNLSFSPYLITNSPSQYLPYSPFLSQANM